MARRGRCCLLCCLVVLWMASAAHSLMTATSTPAPSDAAPRWLALVEVVLATMPARGCLGVFSDALGDADTLLRLLRRLNRPYAVRLCRADRGARGGRMSTAAALASRCGNNVVLLGQQDDDDDVLPVVEGELGPRESPGGAAARRRRRTGPGADAVLLHAETVGRAHHRAPLMRFVFAWTVDAATSRAVLDATMAAVWRTGHVNVLALSASPEGSGNHDLFAFHPFSRGRCNDTKALRVATWTERAGLNMARGLAIRSLFPFGRVEKLRRIKLAGCPVRVGFLNTSNYLHSEFDANQSWRLWGVGREILDACARVLSFRPELIPMPEAHRITDGDSSVVPSGLYDMALFPGMKFGREAMCGYYAFWCITFAVPLDTKGRLPLLVALTGSLQSATWWMLLGAVLLAAVVVRAVVAASGPAEGPVLHTAGGVACLVLSPLVARPLHPAVLPRTPALRNFISCWMYFGLVMSTAYTSAQRSIMLAPAFGLSLFNVRLLADSDMTVVANDIGLDNLEGASQTDPDLRQILQRTRRVHDKEIREQIANPREAIVSRRDQLVSDQRQAIGRCDTMSAVLNGPGVFRSMPSGPSRATSAPPSTPTCCCC